MTELRPGRRFVWPAVIVIATLAGALAAGCREKNDPPPVTAPPPPADLDKQVQVVCSHCHAYPPADTFPRSAWKEEVEQAYRFAAAANMPAPMPPIDSVVSYFEERAPEQLPAAVFEKSDTPLPVKFQRTALPLLALKEGTAVSNVNLVHLSDPKKLDVLACEMRTGRVLLYKPYEESPSWRVLAEQSHPAHAEVVDLDGDGIKDIIVANLGSFTPTDRRCGSVVWLRGKADGTFTPITLLDKRRPRRRRAGRRLQRRRQARPDRRRLRLARDRRDHLPGKPDHRLGPPRIRAARGRRRGTAPSTSRSWTSTATASPTSSPSSARNTKPSSPSSTTASGNFRKETIYNAPHPAYGSSGIQLVDLERRRQRRRPLHQRRHARQAVPAQAVPQHAVAGEPRPRPVPLEAPPDHAAVRRPSRGGRRLLRPRPHGHRRRQLLAEDALPAAPS